MNNLKAPVFGSFFLSYKTDEYYIISLYSSVLLIDFNVENCIEILELTESGRVKTVKFGNKNLSGVEARTLLGLRSTNFDITIDGDNIKFSVIGYGHGVGMSQTGADALAKQGLNYVDIIKHFYIGIEITNM